jgi:hypothetical protein
LLKASVQQHIFNHALKLGSKLGSKTELYTEYTFVVSRNIKYSNQATIKQSTGLQICEALVHSSVRFLPTGIRFIICKLCSRHDDRKI